MNFVYTCSLESRLEIWNVKKKINFGEAFEGRIMDIGYGAIEVERESEGWGERSGGE